MRTAVVLTAVAISLAALSARDYAFAAAESYIQQLKPSARVRPEPPKEQPKPQDGAQVAPKSPSCTAANAMSPECAAATIQSAPVQTVPFRGR